LVVGIESGGQRVETGEADDQEDDEEDREQARQDLELAKQLGLKSPRSAVSSPP
jgi:hypothetical protein